MVDQWGVLYKIDARSGDVGRIVWRMDPGQEKAPLRTAASPCGAISSSRSRTIPRGLIATNKDTGKIVWETNISDGQNGLQFTAAPLPVKDKIIVGASGGDNGVRDFIVAVDAATGKAAWRKYVDSGARRARLRDLEGHQQRLADRRRRHVGDRLIRSRHQPGAVGHRQSGADGPIRTIGPATTSIPTA